jgi:hypothetical protein
MNRPEISAEARSITNLAELNLPKDLAEVNKTLMRDMQTMSAKDYNELLVNIRNDNDQDLVQNGYLPTLQFTNDSDGVVPNHISTKYVPDNLADLGA